MTKVLKFPKSNIVRVRGNKSKLSPEKKKKVEKVLAKTEKSLSTFKKEYKQLKKLVGSKNKDFQSDKASMAMLRSMLTMILSCIPVAESIYKQYRNERSAYALSALVSQARELNNDIRNVHNLQDQLDRIMDLIIKPSLTLIVQNLVDELNTSGRSIMKKVKNKTIVKKMLKKSANNVSLYVQEHANSIGAQLQDYMVDKK